MQCEKRHLKTGKTCEAESEGKNKPNEINQMKKLNKLVLSQLSKIELENRQQNSLRGGRRRACCSCNPYDQLLGNMDSGDTSQGGGGCIDYDSGKNLC